MVGESEEAAAAEEKACKPPPITAPPETTRPLDWTELSDSEVEVVNPQPKEGQVAGPGAVLPKGLPEHRWVELSSGDGTSTRSPLGTLFPFSRSRFSNLARAKGNIANRLLPQGHPVFF
ncbi:uncharacterized protein LOC127277847 [Leptopilina boulardi]|uniref:uncharacterized protein LOC127277847 n=1 Tax=Leptopilina boulardi TaxID=63433 RepID=UPI0021F5C1A9|nr:uncharacterized protein LOC127277847 [Leptopilina boulardi]